MSADVIGLALASAVRPTSVAAVYALLCTRRPRSLLVVYLVAGFTVSTAVGAIVVGALHRTVTDPSPPAWVDVVLGGLAIGAAVGAGFTHRLGRGGARDGSPREQHSSRTSYPLAALGGVVTHLPGLFYLAALNDILAEGQSLPAALLQVLVFNGIWFSAAAGALVMFVLRPSRTRAQLRRVNEWAAQHDRALVSGVFAVVGLYLLTKGIAGLTG